MLQDVHVNDYIQDAQDSLSAIILHPTQRVTKFLINNITKKNYNKNGSRCCRLILLS